jgi:hypothetical protein
MTADAYAVLGISPESEDVVVRAAYRALMQKYTSLTRLDAPDDDQRAREIQAAYDRVATARRSVFAPPAAPVALFAESTQTEAPPAGALEFHPPWAEPADPAASTPTLQLPRRSIAWIAGAGALALCAAVAATLWAPSRHGQAAAPAPVVSKLKVRLQRRPAAVSLAKPLPCFVGGRLIGELRLGDCAARNGVASGSLESAVAPVPTVTASSQAPPVAAPLAHTAVSAAPARAPAVRLAVASTPGPHRVAPPAPLVRSPVFAVSPVRPPRAQPFQETELGQAAARLDREARREGPALVRQATEATRRVLAAALKGGPDQTELGDQFAAAGKAEAPKAPSPKPSASPAQRASPEVVSAPVSAEAGAREAVAVTRAFYQALGEGDGPRAVSLIAPEAREQGPLSAERIRRFTSGVRQPIRVTSLRAVDDTTVSVRYQYVSPSNKLCDGTADVATAPRGARVMITGIHATYDCHAG